MDPCRRGRPPLAEPARVYNVKLRLRPGEDDDLIQRLDAVPPRLLSAAVKLGLRNGLLAQEAVSTLPPDDEDGMAKALEGFLY